VEGRLTGCNSVLLYIGMITWDAGVTLYAVPAAIIGYHARHILYYQTANS